MPFEYHYGCLVSSDIWKLPQRHNEVDDDDDDDVDDDDEYFAYFWQQLMTTKIKINENN